MGQFVIFLYFFFLMIRRPPRSTHCISSAASDVYKRQVIYPYYQFVCRANWFCFFALHSIQVSIQHSWGYLLYEFRLRAAGYHGPNPFTSEAIQMIARISEGLSRRINILADKALLAAYSSGSHKVDTHEIRVAEQDARFQPLQPKAPFNPMPLLWGLAGAGIGALLLAMTIGTASRPQTPHVLCVDTCLLYTSPSPRDQA
eukprot:TRINITY_DN1136_c0_g2_i3.p2 TRINITY_DN1136_c0_g2~~TRINITY_DN1136_c0_g2_i3.p2  ORF type:complete len:201 (-),score=25.68 TRINITY_DN1136_c0_g2_i3:103-705(-)